MHGVSMRPSDGCLFVQIANSHRPLHLVNQSFTGSPVSRIVEVSCICEALLTLGAKFYDAVCLGLPGSRSVGVKVLPRVAGATERI